jgi:2-methylcitrate dehydratase PrpD
VEPTTPYKAKFNLPFCVAVAIKFGKVGMSQFSEALLHDDEIRNLMAMVTLRSDPELSHGYPRIWPAKVTLRLRDGRILEGYNEHPKGDPENPITDKECIDKFESLTAPLVNKAFADAVVTRILNLERETDVSCLLRDF